MINFTPGLTIAMVEREMIYAALRHFEGNKVHAAASLGITSRTILNKLNEYEGRKSDETEETVKNIPPVARTRAQKNS